MNKTELRYFSTFYVDKIYRLAAQTENYGNYLLERFPFQQTYAKGSTELVLSSDFTLDPDKDDLYNSMHFYEAMNLTELQASDERLWVYLTHVHFWDYMRKRWPVKGLKNPISRIRERYFLRSMNLETLTRNGLSRLWWYAHLTVDQKRQNKYDLLEVLLQRQDLVVGITERSLGANRKVRTGLLEFFKDHPQIASNEDKSRAFIKNLNLFGGVKMLPYLQSSEIKQVLAEIKAALA